MDVQIPANWVGAGYGVPTVCSRHGEPAERMRRIRLISRPPQWSYVLLVVGALPFLIVVHALRKTVKAPAWPFCVQCRSRSRLWASIGLGMVALAVVTWVGAAVVSDENVSPLLVLFGVLLLIAGIVVASQAAPQNSTRAQVSGDGMW